MPPTDSKWASFWAHLHQTYLSEPLELLWEGMQVLNMQGNVLMYYPRWLKTKDKEAQVDVLIKAAHIPTGHSL